MTQLKEDITTELLNSVSLIKVKYEGIAKETGENYNIFKILGLTTNEVRTHSAFIGDLINPKGSHGFEDKFLNLFLELIERTDLDSKNCVVEIEKHIGGISENYEEGGRIDLIITDKKNHKVVIIENKIYAGDQYKQLVRYNNYHINPTLLYLTLEGGKPSAESTKGLKDEIIASVKCISYKYEIIKWLEACRNLSGNHVLLRETITQYINLIKFLTKQTNNTKMENEIVTQICLNKNNLESAELIVRNFDNAKTHIINGVINSLQGYKIADIEIGVNQHLGPHKTLVTYRVTDWKYTIAFTITENHEIMSVGLYREDAFSDNTNNFPKFSTLLADLSVGLQLANKGTYPYNWAWLCNWSNYDTMTWEEVYSGKLKAEAISLLEDIIARIKDNPLLKS